MQAFIDMIYMPTLMMLVDILTKVASALMVRRFTDHMMGKLGRTTEMVLAAKSAGGWPEESDVRDFSDDDTSSLDSESDSDIYE